jgi:small subunit ribosomal protein S17
MRGIIVSTKSKNTAVVKVERVLRHPKLFKTITRHKNFTCSLPSEFNPLLGQEVEIRGTSPKSATKSWLIVKVYDTAKNSIKTSR